MKMSKKIVVAVSAIALCGALSTGAAAGNASWSTTANSSYIGASASCTGTGIELEAYAWGEVKHDNKKEYYTLDDSDYGEETTLVSVGISPSVNCHFESGFAWVKVNGSEVERSTV